MKKAITSRTVNNGRRCNDVESTPETEKSIASTKNACRFQLGKYPDLKLSPNTYAVGLEPAHIISDEFDNTDFHMNVNRNIRNNGNNKKKPIVHPKRELNNNIDETTCTNIAKTTQNINCKIQDENIFELNYLTDTEMVRTSTPKFSSKINVSKRVESILKREKSGIWAVEVQRIYEQEYSEELPPDWIQILDANENIYIEKNQNNLYSLRYKHYKQDLVNVQPMKLDHIKNNSLVTVGHVVSTIEIWLHLQKSKNFVFHMENFYRKVQLNAAHIAVGAYYVVKHNGGTSRVKVLAKLDDMCECFFIDLGTTNYVAKCNFYTILAHYAENPAQAFLCSLDGLEDMCASSYAVLHLKQLIGNHYEVKINHKGNIPKVTLYETVNDIKINVNEELIKKIYKNFTHNILIKDETYQVYVTHAELNGVVYIQFQNSLYNRYINYMNKLLQIDFTKITNYAYKKNEISKDVLYITKWSADQEFYRCKIDNCTTDLKFVKVFFVDYGNTEIFELENSVLYSAVEVLEPLSWFPFQSLKVYMDIEGDFLNEKFPERILEVMNPEKPVWMKVLTNPNASKIFCEFFKQSDENKAIFSVNASFKLEQELPMLYNDNDDRIELKSKMEELNKKMEKIWGKSQNNILNTENKKNIPLLKTITIPASNNYFDVFVANVISPWHFYVRPYESGCQLNKLMKDLQQYCKSYKNNEILNFVPNMIVGIQFEDNLYYRARIIKILNKAVLTFLVDYGQTATIDLTDLINLEPQFLQLPAQALKAKLADIKPASNNNMDQNYFEKLVCQKNFVSVIKNTETKPDGDIVCLEMWDTSSKNDVNIAQVLVAQGIAENE